MVKKEQDFDKKAIVEMVKGINRPLTFDDVIQALTKKKLKKKKKS